MMFKTKIKENKDFELVEQGNEDYSIKLLTKFPGVIYQYTKVNISRLEFDTLSFEYYIHDYSKYSKSNLENNENFINQIGDILRILIIEGSSKDSLQITEKDI